MPSLQLANWSVDGNHIEIEGYGSRIPSSKNWLKALRDRTDICNIAVGFSDEGNIKNFLSRKSPAIYVPIHDWQGELVGGYFRSIEGRFHHEHMGSAPFIFPKSREQTDALIIVEGVLDMFSIEVWHPMVFGMGSSSLSSFQLDWLRLMYISGWKPTIIFIYDTDPDNQAGLIGSVKSVKECSKYGIDAYRVPTPYGVKDPGDLYGDERLGSVIDQYLRVIS